MTQLRALKTVVKTQAEKWDVFYDKWVSLKKRSDLLKAHPQYSSAQSKIKEYEVKTFVDPAREDVLLAETYLSLSDEELKVLRKQIELQKEAEVLANEMGELWDETQSIEQRYNDFTIKRIATIAEYPELFALALEIKNGLGGINELVDSLSE